MIFKNKLIFLKNIIGIVLISFWVYHIVMSIDYLNNIAGMGDSMVIISNSIYSIVSLFLGTIFILIGARLLSFSVANIYLMLFGYCSVFIFKNIWFYGLMKEYNYYFNHTEWDYLRYSNYIIPSIEVHLYGLFFICLYLYLGLTSK
ncbi:MAG: Unknown protein [uncultured Sulfurovum sp.]|uniref:Uncharacterized protein n=1 Tax=uncultured Sulfurovum sp. TaxID=269237 RepID=A0A6S6UJC4_9BACT|nr:MAG: Unknown protein [uncultured Sulfurovum sp.]